MSDMIAPKVAHITPDTQQTDARLPWAARTLDLLALVSILIATTVLVTGGFREWTPFGRISVTSPFRPLIAGLVFLFVRHAIWRRPILPVEVYRAVRRWWATSESRIVLPAVLTTRIGVLVVGFLGVVLIGYAPAALPFRVYENEFLNLPARWDAGWYLGIAVDGYQWRPAAGDRQQNIAFFPVYPMLMRYTALLVGRQLLWAGVLISFVSFFLASVYLYKFARRVIGEEPAGTAVLLMATYPYAFFYSVAYTEAVFLLTIVAACYHFERDELWQSALWGLAAGLTRPNGCLLSIVLALIAIRPLWTAGWRPSWPQPMGFARLADRIAVAAAPGIGMLIYSTYIYYLTGNPLQWAAQNAAWGRVYRSLDVLVSERVQWIDQGFYEYASTRTLDMIQVAAVVFVLAMVWPIFRRLGLAYAALIVVNVVPPLTMGGFLSMGRLTAVLFPVFVWLASAIPVAHRSAWIAGFAMLQALGAVVFFTWRQLY